MDRQGGDRVLQDEMLVAISIGHFNLQLDAADRETVLSRLNLWRRAYSEMEAVDVTGIEPAFLLIDET